jgi:hypothetical protein
VEFKEAFLDGVCKGVSIDDRLPALYEGHRPVVYLERSSREWLLIGALMVACLIYLTLWGSFVRGRLTRTKPRWVPSLLWGRPGDPSP